jgi:hypothetical protein
VLDELPAGFTDHFSPPRSWPVYVSIDPHPQTPHAVLFVAVSPLGQKFIFDEIFQQVIIEELVELIHQKTILRGYTIANPVKCDPFAWINDPITGSCMAEEFMRHGLMVEKASKDKSFGVLNMEAQFRKENNIYVNPYLQRWLYEISHYVYDKENKPIDKDDHLMEAMYRLFINEPLYFDTYQSSETSLPHVAFDMDPLAQEAEEYV